MSGESDVRVGVFATDPGIRVMQGYTTDRSVDPAGRQSNYAGRQLGCHQKAERRDEIMDRRRELQSEQLTMAAATATGGRRQLAANGAQMGRTRRKSDCSRWNVR